MPTPSRKRTGQIILSAAFLALAATATTACGDDKPDGEEKDFKLYCTDGDGNVVDEDRCDNDGDNGGSSGFFFMHVPIYNSSGGYHPTYAPGQKIPAGVYSGKISAADAAARKSWGLSPTGRVTNGTVKTGIVGKGGGAPVGKAGGGVAPGKGAGSGG